MVFGYSIWSVVVICIGVFLASLIDAIGGGGGLISVPAYLIAGFPTHLALGTNKLSSLIGTSVSTARFLKNGYINWQLAIPSVVLALGGSYFGTSLQLLLNEKYLRFILIPVLLIAALVMLKEKNFPEEAGEIGAWKQRIIIYVAAFILGMYDGFYGPGSSAFMLIVFCRFAKMDLHSAAGNVKIVTVASNIASLVTSFIAGKVLVPIGLIAAVFSIIGHYIGAGLMIKNGSKIVTPVIFTVLGLLFVKIILETFGVNLSFLA